VGQDRVHPGTGTEGISHPPRGVSRLVRTYPRRKKEGPFPLSELHGHSGRRRKAPLGLTRGPWCLQGIVIETKKVVPERKGHSCVRKTAGGREGYLRASSGALSRFARREGRIEGVGAQHR